jgi:ribosome modulation factor
MSKPHFQKSGPKKQQHPLDCNIQEQVAYLTALKKKQDLEEELAAKGISIIVPASEKQAKKKGICKFHSNDGGCKNKDKCPFEHPESKKGICRYHANDGGCKNKDKCPFEHPDSKKADNVSTQKKGICRYHLNDGGCKNKDKCPFEHPDSKKIDNILPFHKKEICKFNLYDGGCKNRNTCSFDHPVDKKSELAHPNRRKDQPISDFMEIVAKFTNELSALSLTDPILIELQKSCLAEIKTFESMRALAK